MLWGQTNMIEKKKFNCILELWTNFVNARLESRPHRPPKYSELRSKFSAQLNMLFSSSKSIKILQQVLIRSPPIDVDLMLFSGLFHLSNWIRDSNELNWFIEISLLLALLEPFVGLARKHLILFILMFFGCGLERALVHPTSWTQCSFLSDNVSRRCSCCAINSTEWANRRKGCALEWDFVDLHIQHNTLINWHGAVSNRAFSGTRLADCTLMEFSPSKLPRKESCEVLCLSLHSHTHEWKQTRLWLSNRTALRAEAVSCEAQPAMFQNAN